jgi:tetratricopeptide (TPR) repeat protein
MLTEYRVRIASNARDWLTAQHLHDAIVARHRQLAANLLTLPPDALTEDQRATIRRFAIAVETLGHLQREQGQPGCVDHYLEAMELFQRIGARREEGVIAFNLGHAYAGIPALRDLDQAEQWYRRRLELVEGHDTLGRARTTGQLGAVAYLRFLDAHRAGEPAGQQARHLTDAATAYQQALDLLPPNAVDVSAVIHHQLGIIYSSVGDTDAALRHYQQAIQLEERRDDRYSAGQSRHAAAAALAEAGRNQQALLYAHAALRDYQAVGLGTVAIAEQARQLITQLQQKPPGESNPS